MPASELPFRLLLITDRHQVRSGELVSTVERALGGEAPHVAVLLRDKDLPRRERLQLARQLRLVTRAAGSLLLVHGDHAIAREVGADGIHVPDSTEARRALQAADSTWIVGASCHGRDSVAAAAQAGVHYATLSPILPSPGKADAGDELGFAALGGTWPIPILALGGMGPQHYAIARSAGAWGIAGIRAFLTGDVAEAVRSCREAPSP